MILMVFIDTHAHLNSELYDKDRKAVIDSAAARGIRAIINCATSFENWDSTLALSGEFSLLKSALGVHPWYIPENYAELLKERDLEIFRRISAVGEIGLDSRFTKTPLEHQKKVFTDFLSIAREFRLPATVHCIGAFDALFEVLKKTGPLEKGLVLHAFNGSAELAESLFRYNVYFSVGGTVTYLDSRKRAEMLKKIFPHRMLLETDSPDIPVSERKNERNLPENIIFIANAAARILNEPVEKIAEATTNLANKIFGV